MEKHIQEISIVLNLLYHKVEWQVVETCVLTASVKSHQ